MRSSIVKTLAAIGAITVGLVGYETYNRNFQEAAKIREARELAEKERLRAEEYKRQLHSVLSERKTTRFRVLETEDVLLDGKTTRRNKLRIVQWTDEGKRVFSQEIEIVGHKIYFEGVVVHLQRDRLVKGDRNLHLLVRVFSDELPPSKGIPILNFQLDAADKLVREEIRDVPRDKRMASLNYIRRIAGDQEFARSEGVRAINGQAVCDYQDLEVGYVYTIVEKSDGAYLIEKAPIP